MLLCPVQSPCRKTQDFGERPTVYAQFGLKGHNGIDLTGPTKGVLVPIYSALEGYVHQVGDQGAKGYGKFVRIRSTSPDNQGRLKETVYGHLSRIDVKEGQFMPLGEPLGIMGATGFADAPHLHFGLRFLNLRGLVLNEDNGFSGYIDQWPYLRFWVDGPEKDRLVTLV